MSFIIRGADVDLNTIKSTANSFQPNWQILVKNAGINLLRFLQGSEGDVFRINMTANSDWAVNLKTLFDLVRAAGCKLVLYTLGDPWRGMLGITDPIYNQVPMDINTAKGYIDQLKGNNSLGYDFLTDPVVYAWSFGNECVIARYTNATTYSLTSSGVWCLAMADYIRSLGGKTVAPSYYVDTSVINGDPNCKQFRYVEPLIRGHFDIIEMHIYGLWELQNMFRIAGGYNWSGWQTYLENYFRNEFMNQKGSFTVDRVFLGEFGIFRGAASGVNYTDDDRREFYTRMFQIFKAVGLPNVCFHYLFEPIGYSAQHENYSVVGMNGEILPYAYDIIKQNYAQALIYYDINVEIPINGTCVPVGTQHGSAGTTLTVTATSFSGYHFKEWLLDGNPSGVYLPTITVTFNANHTLEAIFEADITPPPPNYRILTIVANSAQGTTQPSISYMGVVDSSVSVTAIALAGYHFKEWILDATAIGSINPVSILLNRDHTLEAVFEADAVIPQKECAIASATEGTVFMNYLPAVRRFRDRCLPADITRTYYRSSLFIAPRIRKLRRLKGHGST